jgi:hypothetical protein
VAPSTVSAVISSPVKSRGRVAWWASTATWISATGFDPVGAGRERDLDVVVAHVDARRVGPRGGRDAGLDGGGLLGGEGCG